MEYITYFAKNTPLRPLPSLPKKTKKGKNPPTPTMRKDRKEIISISVGTKRLFFFSLANSFQDHLRYDNDNHSDDKNQDNCQVFQKKIHR